MAKVVHDLPKGTTLVRAHPSDFPTFARISAEAMSVDLLHRVMFPSTNLLDSTPQESQVLDELERAKAPPMPGQPEIHVWKVVRENEADMYSQDEISPTRDGSNILGWALFKVQKGQQETSSQQQAPGSQNQDDAPDLGLQAPSYMPETGRAFFERLGKEYGPAIAKAIGDRPHMLRNFLMVRPQQQGQGLGSAMMRYGLENLGGHKLPCLVITQDRLHDWYAKFGFKDVHTVDVDMSEFMGKNRGFGVHRSNVMLRPAVG